MSRNDRLETLLKQHYQTESEHIHSTEGLVERIMEYIHNAPQDDPEYAQAQKKGIFYQTAVANDYCDTGCGNVANYETEHGILCENCYAQLYRKEGNS